MEIQDVLKENLMLFHLKAEKKNEVIEELIEKLTQEGYVSDERAFLEAVLEREKQSTTGIGMGIAIPHGKSDVVSETSIVFGKSQRGIEFEALDGKKSNLFFLIAVAEGANNEHLRILSRLSRKLMNEEIRGALLKAETAAEVVRALEG